MRSGGRNLVGYRATFTVTGQRGTNITMCASFANDHIPTIDPYNTKRLITFLNALHERLIPPEKKRLLPSGMPMFIIIWIMTTLALSMSGLQYTLV